MHFVEIHLLEFGLFILVFEGDNIFITSQTQNKCHILEPESQYAFTYLEILGAIVIHLHQRVQHPPPLQYRFHIH